MLTIADRLDRAIEDIEKGAIDFALESICIALDLTAQRTYHRSHSDKRDYKKLINDYSWLVELIGLPGLNLEDSRFGNYPIRGNPTPSFQDLVYHIVRCGLVHDIGVPNNFQFAETHLITLDQDLIEFPITLVWALLAIVVFCPCNSGERLSKPRKVVVAGQDLLIDDYWGKVDLAKGLYARYKPIRVILNIGADRGYPMVIEFKPSV